MSYLLRSDLLSNRQYGFVHGRSTMLQLLHILDEWTEDLESGGLIDVIYTDYEKAFDKVPHRRLLNTIFSFGLPIQIVNWIKFFLHNRFHKVKINSLLSDSYPVLSGITQGSVLGPLLFIMYINDLADICIKDETDIYLYADDAKIYKDVFSKADQD